MLIGIYIEGVARHTSKKTKTELRVNKRFHIRLRVEGERCPVCLSKSKQLVHNRTVRVKRHGNPCRYLRGPPPVSTQPVIGRASVGARVRHLSSAPACMCV